MSYRKKYWNRQFGTGMLQEVQAKIHESHKTVHCTSNRKLVYNKMMKVYKILQGISKVLTDEVIYPVQKMK